MVQALLCGQTPIKVLGYRDMRGALELNMLMLLLFSVAMLSLVNLLTPCSHDGAKPKSCA